MSNDKPFKLDVVSVRLNTDFEYFSDVAMCSPEDVAKVASEMLYDLDREVVAVFNLKSDGRPINCQIVSIGTLSESIAHPRELIKSSILSNAASMIICHNHPSGSLEPSNKDIEMTDRMTNVCNLIGVHLLDHIIVSGLKKGNYLSMLEEGILERSRNGGMVVKSEYLKDNMVAERSNNYGTSIYERRDRDSKVR